MFVTAKMVPQSTGKTKFREKKKKKEGRRSKGRRAGGRREGEKQAKFSSQKKTLTGLAGGLSSRSSVYIRGGRKKQYETHVWIKEAGHGLCYSCHSARAS